MPRWDRDYFPPSTPRPVDGGVRPHSGRQFGANWWAKRWIGALEGLGLGSRLQRGRSYARRGQVVSIEIAPGKVQAKVQGSRRQPYSVTITLKPLSADLWSAVGREIAAQASYAAALLAGEMPKDIDVPFRAAGASLFPERRGDLQTQCSCPDWENPCKHIAAVFYIMGDELDRDPFLLFRLRGLGPKDLPGILSAGEHSQGNPDSPQAEPLPSAPDRFWSSAPAARDPLPPPAPPVQLAPLLRHLGNPPFWRGRLDLAEWLAPVYAEASSRAVAWLTEAEDMPSDGEAPPAPRPARKSLDRAALAAEVAADVPLAELAARYDGRILRPYRTRRPG